MPEITFTGPVLIEDAGEVRVLTADDVRGGPGPSGPQGPAGEALAALDGGVAKSITIPVGLDGGGAVWR